MLESFTSQLLFNHATFTGFTSAYNHQFKTKEIDNINNDRNVLIEKRLTEGWFYYRTLLFYFEINQTFEGFNFVYLQDLNENINSLKKFMLPHFIKKWSGNYIKCIIVFTF